MTTAHASGRCVCLRCRSRGRRRAGAGHVSHVHLVKVGVVLEDFLRRQMRAELRSDWQSQQSV